MGVIIDDNLLLELEVSLFKLGLIEDDDDYFSDAWLCSLSEYWENYD